MRARSRSTCSLNGIIVVGAAGARSDRPGREAKKDRDIDAISPPRPHEDVELLSPSSEDYLTPMRGQSRFKPYPLMANGYTVRSVVREMHKTRDELRFSPHAT